MFSILTDNSLFEFFLIKVVAQVNNIIEASDAPTPIGGHLRVSNKGVACGCVVITW